MVLPFSRTGCNWTPGKPLLEIGAKYAFQSDAGGFMMRCSQCTLQNGNGFPDQVFTDGADYSASLTHFTVLDAGNGLVGLQVRLQTPQQHLHAMCMPGRTHRYSPHARASCYARSTNMARGCRNAASAPMSPICLCRQHVSMPLCCGRRTMVCSSLDATRAHPPPQLRTQR